ncbi:hypothetical protein ACFQ1L_11830 [Phytohabitans flavus]|uniref:hypothetical protein n=1 Tax=Phytohabitans flavus TaxID=1076124 RepID=UPI003640115E
MAKERVEFDVIGNDRGGSKAFRDTGDSAAKAGRQVGDFKGELKDLDTQIDASKKELVELARAFAKSGGDGDLWKDLRRQKGELRKILDVRKIMEDAGGDAAKGFSAGFVGRVGPLMARAPLSPPLLAAIGAAAPALTATLSTAIGVGAATGAVALGAAISTRNPQVAAGIADLKAYIGSQLQASAQPFVPAMLREIGRVKLEVQTIRPELDAVFAKSSTYLEPLTEGAVGFVRNALPGFRSLVDAAEPLVEIFGEELPELGGDFASLMESIGDSAARNEDEFRAILDTTGLIVQNIGFAIDKMDYLGSGPTRAFLDGIRKAQDELSQIQQVSGTILGDAPESLRGFLYGAKELAEPFNLAADATRSFREEMDKLINDQLSLEQATIDWQAAIDATTEAAKRNGSTMDANTEKGRNNRQALKDQAQAGLEYAQAIYDEKAALGDVVGAEAAAERAYQQSRAALVKSATQMLGSKEKAEAYVTSILGIPRPGTPGLTSTATTPV